MTDNGIGADTAPMHRDRSRASSFGANAELYDRSRPSYPAALVDDLVARGPTSVLDVGCGTGLLGRAFVRRGLRVTGVEPDERMAEVATKHGIDVEVSSFEQWPATARRFDLLVSGQAWHWVEPVAGAQKAAEVLAPGATIALAWNIAEMQSDLRARLDVVYAELAHGAATPVVANLPHVWMHPGTAEEALAQNGAFCDLEHTAYPWERQYTRDEWLAQLETHSDHHLMDPDDRAGLLGAVGAAIDGLGGSFTMRYQCRVTMGRRR